MMMMMMRMVSVVLTPLGRREICVVEKRERDRNRVVAVIHRGRGVLLPKIHGSRVKVESNRRMSLVILFFGFPFVVSFSRGYLHQLPHRRIIGAAYVVKEQIFFFSIGER